MMKHNIFELPEEEIRSGIYVVETLEASVWCLLTTGSYEEAVTKAVNPGGDTDTTGAVTECEAYEPLLPDDVVYFRFQIEDSILPPIEDMYNIIIKIEELVAAGRRVYVHCWGGIDRTGGVVAAWFAKHHHMTADEALTACINRWETNPKAKTCVGTPIIQSEPEYLQMFIGYCTKMKQFPPSASNRSTNMRPTDSFSPSEAVSNPCQSTQKPVNPENSVILSKNKNLSINEITSLRPQ